MSTVTQLPASQIIGLCDECIAAMPVVLTRVPGRVLECMACDRKESSVAIRRCRVTPADFALMADYAS